MASASAAAATSPSMLGVAGGSVAPQHSGGHQVEQACRTHGAAAHTWGQNCAPASNIFLLMNAGQKAGNSGNAVETQRRIFDHCKRSQRSTIIHADCFKKIHG